MSRPRQIRLTREGLYYTVVVAAVLAGAVSRQLNLLMLLGSVLAGPLVFSLIYGRFALRRIRIQRGLPQFLRAEERLLVDVRVTNQRRRWAIWGIHVEDSLSCESTTEVAPPSKVGVFFPRIRAAETAHASYEGRLPRRGRYRFGPLRISTRFPLGLVRHKFTLAEEDELLVHPKLGRLAHDWAQVERENVSGTQRMARRGVSEADYYGLRDWRAGDSRRWIHWRTSARRGSLVVRQFEHRRSQDLAILVDLWQPKRPFDYQEQNVELAVSFLATLLTEACRQSGRRILLNIAAAEPLDRSGSASGLFLREQMDALALVQPHHEIKLPASVGHALALVPPAVPTLLVSTRPIDWETLETAAAERDSHLAGRQVQAIDVSGSELARYFHR